MKRFMTERYISYIPYIYIYTPVIKRFIDSFFLIKCLKE